MSADDMEDVTVSWEFSRSRQQWRIRERGVVDGAPLDRRRVVPRGLFPQSVPHNRQTRRSEEIARDYARQVADARRTAPRHDPMAPTLATLFNLYRVRQVSQLKPETLDRCRKYAAALARFFDAQQIQPASIRLGDAERYRDSRLADNLSPRTVSNELRWLQQLLRWALDHSDETGVRSIALTKAPGVIGKRGVRPKFALTPEQFGALLAATEQLPRSGDVLRRILIFGVCSRLRKTPLLAMAGQYIDRKRAWLTVPADLNKGRGNDYRQISVPLPRWVLTVTADLPKRGLLWPSQRTGTSYNPDSLAASAAATAPPERADRDGLMVSLVSRHRAHAIDVAGLTWQAVDVSNGEIREIRARRRMQHIRLSPADAERLRRLHENKGSNPHVFTSTGGATIGKRTVWLTVARAKASTPAISREDAPMQWINKALTRACELAKLPPITLHDLRRTGNSWLISHRCRKHRGAVDSVVRERLLEHVSPELTAAYHFITDDTLREAAGTYDCIRKEIGA
jgi:integrase